MLVNRLMRRDRNLGESLRQKLMKGPAARQNRQTVFGRFLRYVMKHAFYLIGNVKVNVGFPASPRFTASCCSDGSLAVIQPLWLHRSLRTGLARACVTYGTNSLHFSPRAGPLLGLFFGSVFSGAHEECTANRWRRSSH